MPQDFLAISQKDFYNHLKQLSDDYYQSQSKVSDDTFDDLVNLYKVRFDEDFAYLGKAGNAKLPVWMGSLDKCKDDKALKLFKDRCETNSFVISDKVDGLSLLIVFNKDGTRKAYTRGDGQVGKDVTFILDHIKFVKNLDWIIKLLNQNGEEKLIVRGEIVMFLKTFETYSQQFKNPRNTVAGLVNAKELNPKMLSECQFLAYHIHNCELFGFNTREQVFKELETLGFQTPYFKKVQSNFVTQSVLKAYLEERKMVAPYEIDGLVVSEDLIKDEKAGENPKFSIAFKKLGETAVVKVKDVEWNVTKNGVIKPRINIDPVDLSGVTITNLTAFNAKFVDDNKIGPNTELLITRSGDVIPHILQVIKGTKAKMPSREWIWNQSGVDILIVNDGSEDKDVWVKRMVCLFNTTDTKGLKEGVLTNLYEGGITDEEKLFSVTKEELLSINKIKEKSAENILDGIKDCLSKLTLVKLMVGSCLFPNFGETKLTKILDNLDFSNILLGKELFLEEYYDDHVQDLNNLGFNKTAEQFLDSINPFVEYYLKYQHVFPLRQQVKKEVKESLGGVCFSGFRNKDLMNEFIKMGYTEDDDVKKTTKYLVVKDVSQSTGKTKKAEKYGVEIISEEDAQELF